MTNGCFQRLILSGALLLLPFTALAQNLATGTITGVARDNTGAVLPGVTVEAASPALIEKARTVVTDGQGVYRIIELRPGTYNVTFALSGFDTRSVTGVLLGAGQTVVLDQPLPIASLSEIVEVKAPAPPLRPPRPSAPPGAPLPRPARSGGIVDVFRDCVSGGRVHRSSRSRGCGVSAAALDLRVPQRTDSAPRL